MQWPYEAAAVAFEAIPRTLAQNCGVNVIRTMTALQGKVMKVNRILVASSFIYIYFSYLCRTLLLPLNFVISGKFVELLFFI